MSSIHGNHEVGAGLKYQLKTFEKIPIKFWDNPDEGAIQIARYIALCMRQKQQVNEHIVLGLATGSSPIKIYNELVRMHREESLSFYNVITFNLDEYYPMKPESNQSYVKFMYEYLFNHIDIKPENIHIPNGDIPMEYVENFCLEYEKKIELHGGIDIQILGISRTGHIGFNEPGSWLTSRTRLVKLDHLTRIDAVKDFGKEENVPYRAITMGINTIMKARPVFIMAWGTHKASIVQQTVEGDITEMIPATYLQNHPNVKFYLDAAASSELTRIKTPWLAGICNWDDKLIAKEFRDHARRARGGSRRPVLLGIFGDVEVRREPTLACRCSLCAPPRGLHAALFFSTRRDRSGTRQILDTALPTSKREPARSEREQR